MSRSIKHVSKPVQSSPNYIGEPHMVLFYGALFFLLLFGWLWLVGQILSGPNPLDALLTPAPTKAAPQGVVQVGQTDARAPVNPTAQPTPQLVAESRGECPDPRTVRQFIVCADVLSVLSSVPVSNDPALFGDAQIGAVSKGDQLIVLGRFTTTLENGIEARFLVLSFDGRKALVFHMKLDATFTTNVDDGYYNTNLPETPFP